MVVNNYDDYDVDDDDDDNYVNDDDCADDDDDNDDDDNGDLTMMTTMTIKFTMSGGDEAEHDSFVECKSLSLLHLYPLLVQTLQSFMRIAWKFYENHMKVLSKLHESFMKTSWS